MHYAIAGGNSNGVAILLNKELKMKELKPQDNNEIKMMVNNHSVDVTPLHLAVSIGFANSCKKSLIFGRSE